MNIADLAWELQARLGDDFEETRRALESTFSALRLQDVSSMIDEVLADAPLLERVARKSYLQGNGFYKLVLGDFDAGALRIHAWFPQNTGEENLHSHRWPFVSRILMGTLVSEFWQDRLGADRGYPELLYTSKDLDLLPIGYASVVKAATASFRKGDVYFMTADQLHRVINQPDIVTVTLMYHPCPTRSFARNIVLNGKLPQIAPAYMTAEQVGLVLERLRDLL